ncbi:MAG: DUF58 domain-containing protein [Egibacteraceae bacterium]
MRSARGVLTTRGLTLLAGGTALWIVARLLGVAELHIVAAASLALVGAGGLSVVLAAPAISVRRTVTPRLAYGARGEVVVDLRNDGRPHSTLLLVEDACPPDLRAAGTRFVISELGTGRAVSLRYPIVAGARGRHTVGPLRILVRDPFGLAQRTRRDAGTDQVLVYPPIEALPPDAIRARHYGDGSSPHRQPFEDGDEFHTMREYVEGDDLRRVHWPSTARRQRLMVRQQEQTRQARAFIFLDIRRCAHEGRGPHSTAEKAIGVAASLVSHLTAHGFQLCLATEADRRGNPARQSPARMLEHLAELAPSSVPGLGPALQQMADAQGLLIAVVRPTPPAAGGGSTESADARALLRAGRGRPGRIALVIASGPGDQRADALAGMLRGAGWRATTIAPGETLASRWACLDTGPHRTATAGMAP